MLTFNLTHAGMNMPGATWESASLRGMTDAEIAAGARASLLLKLEERIEKLRLDLYPASAGKLAVYRIKEGIARDVASASVAELAQIDAEATARGTDRAGLFVLILAEADKTREALLRLEVANATAKAVIEGAADTETSIKLAFASAVAELVSAKTDVSTILAGGS